MKIKSLFSLSVIASLCATSCSLLGSDKTTDADSTATADTLTIAIDSVAADTATVEAEPEVNEFEGATAKFTYHGDDIYLMPKGVVKSTNKAVSGKWKNNSEASGMTTVKEVSFEHPSACVLFMIDDNTAYLIYEGNGFAELMGYDPHQFFVSIETPEGDDLVDLSSVPTAKVTKP